ncbi:MAG: hypothetical protein ACI90V_012833, partial [Bacillariaceae sp.]
IQYTDLLYLISSQNQSLAGMCDFYWIEIQMSIRRPRGFEQNSVLKSIYKIYIYIFI